MFQNDFGPPKHVLHLGWSPFVKYRAIKTVLKVALYDFYDGVPAPLNSQLMEKVNHYNLTKKINFSMGPSVKFVLAIIDSISKKKMGEHFFIRKKTIPGGPRGGLAKDHKKYRVFFGTLPLFCRVCIRDLRGIHMSKEAIFHMQITSM